MTARAIEVPSARSVGVLALEVWRWAADGTSAGHRLTARPATTETLDRMLREAADLDPFAQEWAVLALGAEGYTVLACSRGSGYEVDGSAYIEAKYAPS